MKKWGVILLVLVLVLAVVLGVGYKYWSVLAADCIVRVSYTGFVRLTHPEPYDYYAICGDWAVRVSEEVLEILAPEAVSGSKYQEKGATHWFTQLIYMPRAEMFEGDKFLQKNYPWLSTDFGEQYRVYYQNWGGPKIDAGTDVQAAMVQAAQCFHDGNINNMSSFSYTGERGLTWFIMVSSGERILVQHQEDALYLPMPDGTFQLLMECPDGGQFDYYWFP